MITKKKEKKAKKKKIFLVQNLNSDAAWNLDFCNSSEMRKTKKMRKWERDLDKNRIHHAEFRPASIKPESVSQRGKNNFYLYDIKKK